MHLRPDPTVLIGSEDITEGPKAGRSAPDGLWSQVCTASSLLVMFVSMSGSRHQCSLVISGAAANVDRNEVKNCKQLKGMFSAH